LYLILINCHHCNDINDYLYGRLSRACNNIKQLQSTQVQNTDETVKINTKSGLIEGVSYIPSPNMDERPDGVAIDLVVIHSISLPPGQYGGHWIEKFFCNQLPLDAHPYFKEIIEMKVSSHALIQRDGSILQFVPFHKRAWHAGESSFQGRDACNDFSIGIELEGTDTDAFESRQYDQLASLIRGLEQTYPLVTSDRVTGHSDIAPMRKTDPGSGFDWEKISKLLKRVD